MSDNPLPAEPVVVSRYDPDWPARAATELAALRAALGPVVVAADHIGSTSIPGMAAKDILDLQLSVADLAAADAFRGPLGRLGYVRLPSEYEYEYDHVPAGEQTDPGLWTKRFWSRRDHPAGDANLHVRRTGSPNERLALLFRDWLRAHPLAIAGYSQFKLELARSVTDLERYTDIKDPVVDVIVAAAAQWAADAGWRPHQPG